MFDKLAAIEERFNELEKLICDPEVIADREKLLSYTKERASLEEIVNTYRSFKQVDSELTDVRDMLQEKHDAEMSDFLKEEQERLKTEKNRLEKELKYLLLPKDPNDDKNVIVEIRAGTGGEEAALFASDLLRMYSRYCERKGWKMEMLNMHATDIGGCKEAIFSITAKKAYSKLKYESGVHRVQRIPVTETGGRIHTSTATVAVLPEAEEVEVDINPQDLRTDVFCSTGPGGQSVNTTQSAVRITHLPTGIVVSCQDEKSQLKNKEKAMRVLRARLLDKLISEQQAEVAETRRSQVGTGERSERVRTYNFPQNRVTDHRIGLTLYRLTEILDGDLDEVIDALITSAQAEKLKQVET